MNQTIPIAAFLLATAALTCFAPTALAHDCEAYTGCDASACKDGENHKHVDKNWIGDDESCESREKDQDGGDKGCEFLGEDWPERVCELVNERPIPGSKIKNVPL